MADNTLTVNTNAVAGYIGPVLLAFAGAILFNPGLFPQIAAEIAHSVAVVMLSGVLLLVAGLAIVRVHTVWTGGWYPMLVTALGWLAILSGLIRILLPRQLGQLAALAVENPALPTVTAALLALAGLALIYKAYIAR